MDTIPLPFEFREFLRFLNEGEVKYLLVGGWAVAYHGYVRSTADIDVWIRQDEDNTHRVREALSEFGFADQSVSQTLLQPDTIIRMGRPPMQIEIQTSLSGIDFDAAYARRETVDWDGLNIPLIGREDLLANKEAAGRPKDLADVHELKRFSRD